MTNSFLPFPELETTRCLLRQLDQADAQDVFDIRKRVNEFVDYKRATSIADAQAFIEKIRHFAATGEGLTWAINFKDDPKLAGTIVYWNISEDRSVAEIGYELATAYQGKGIMQE
ncbi:MAG: N-acetyltransferase, partial [Sphingobacteriales bacterium]